MIVDIADLGETHADLLHAADDHGGANDLHHVAHVHRVPEDQRQPDHDILNQTLGAEADRQTDDGRAGEVRGEVDAEFLQDQAEREKVDGEGHGADDEPGDSDKLWLLRHEPERVLLGVAANDEPFAQRARELDQHVGDGGQDDDQEDAFQGIRVVPGKVRVQPPHDGVFHLVDHQRRRLHGGKNRIHVAGL